MQDGGDTADPAPLAPGTRIGKYKVLRLIAVGGMAEIYLARATGIEGFAKAVVLKRILPRLAKDPEFVEMFLDEARLAAAFQHPNVVDVYDIGRAGGSHFFTMEHVHGEDLHGLLSAAKEKRRGLSLANALTVVRGVAAGLHYVHGRKGLDGQELATVHRDVSPSNVMVSAQDDQPKTVCADYWTEAPPVTTVGSGRNIMPAPSSRD